MKRDGNVTVVLMCDNQGTKAFLEDLVCSFHLNIEKECKIVENQE